MKGFTSKYKCTKLVFFETHEDIFYAREREYQIKNLSRAKKLELISAQNPEWDDLYEKLVKGRRPYSEEGRKT